MEAVMKRMPLLIFLLASFALACSLVSGLQPTGETPTQPSLDELPQPGESQRRCGDGICDGPENQDNCPDDCNQLQNESELPSLGTTSEHWVTNPTTGAELYVHITYPSGEGSYPTLVVVPGGIGAGNQFRLPGGMSEALAQVGIVAVAFDADGRGKSNGEEDYNGHAQQDGLAAVIEFAATLSKVDPERIGLASFSYGVTMASGTMARYPDLPVLFLMDWEGPADRFDTTTECNNSTRIDFNPCDDDAYWEQREALVFISDVRSPYQRLQSETDHVQPDVSHAINMVNNAVEGQPPWARLNDLPPNQTYDPDAPPPMIPDSKDKGFDLFAIQYVQELFALHSVP
jgi:dienelactone hydrolase